MSKHRTSELRRAVDAQIVAEGGSWRVARFRDPLAAGPAPCSPAIIRSLEPIRPANASMAPLFDGVDGSWSIRVESGTGTDCYALGEVGGPLRRNGHETICWNSDVPAYKPKDKSLYQSHPWVLGVRADGTAFGLLVDTTWRCSLLPGDRIDVEGEGTRPNVYVVEADGPEGVLEALASLTGYPPLPPRWALGYHQCRWSYMSAARVLEVAKGFRSRSIPCDAIWMDIDYMHGFRCFTFDPETFPDPGALNDELHELGFHSVWMIDPGIKLDPAYAVYDAGSAIDAWVRSAEGEPFSGTVWPGACVFPDFTRADVREWWAGLYRDWLANGIDAVWNDMNEPSVFDGPHKTMPLDNRHRADEALGGPDEHARYHNIYAMLMVRATREGMRRARPDRRPFVLTRSNFIGGHRYAATWTGDNTSNWEDLAASIPMILNLGLSGQPFSGPDIGGFNDNADAHLFARWMGIGALLPFARGHTIMDSRDHEPWSFGKACERTCRRALERRARLVPYLYTLFEEATRTGLPLARPLFFADPADPALRAAEDSFLLGRDLLVRASVKAHGSCHSPMPPGGWMAFEPAEASDADLPELLLRRGSAIPLGPVRQFDAERPLDPLTIVAYPDERDEARCVLYEDDGDGFAYEQGRFRRTTYVVRGGAVHEESVEGSMAPVSRQVRLEILG